MIHTWDIISERFGWMLVWGDYVLVPFFYCLPGWWLVHAPDPLSPAAAMPIVLLFAFGFWLFRGANQQKHGFKRDPDIRIWGQPARTLDGRLLVSGFWGIGRHLNYTGEICIYLAFALTTGFVSWGPYLLPAWLAGLLWHRSIRDERRCRAKYGELWERYTQRARFLDAAVHPLRAGMANRSHSMAPLHTADLPPRPEELVPELAGRWPLIGHLREFQRDPVAMLSRGWREHGDLFRFRLGVRDFVLFTGPEAHDFYFRAPETQLNAKAVYRFTVPVFGRGVAYDTSPEIMAEQLGFLFPALREAAMRKFALIMFEEASAFADALGEEGDIDLPHAMNELTVRIASRCLIGQEVRDRVDTGFAEAYHDLQKGINTLGVLPSETSYPRAQKPRPGPAKGGGHLRRDHGRAPPCRGRPRRLHADAHECPLQGWPRSQRRRDHGDSADGTVRGPAHQRGARDLDRP